MKKISNNTKQDLAQLTAPGLQHQPSTNQSESVIHFPHDQSLGDLYLVNEKGEVNLIGHALGEVYIPMSSRVFLYYNYDQVYGCSRLTRIASNSLYGLSFLATEITDSDLQFIKHLDSLEELDVSCTSVGNQCLEHLLELPILRKLNLSSTKITGKSIDLFRRFKSLIELVLDDTDIDDQWLIKLDRLNRLERLSLSFTNITSRGLLKIRSLRNLKVLRLNRTNVSNAGIDFLVCLNQLEELWLRSTPVTYGGLVELKKKLPNCQILY